MTPVEHLNRLDELIVEHTKASVTAKLRNQLTVTREQVEALDASYAKLKNEHMVVKNLSEEKIARLEEEHAKLVSENKGLASQLAIAKKEKDAMSKPKRRTTSGELVVDGILWAYTGDDDTGEWVRFIPLCPHCRTQLCVEDVTGFLALRPEDHRIRYSCDHDSCRKFDETFRGTSEDREEKARRHILKKHEEEKPA